MSEDWNTDHLGRLAADVVTQHGGFVTFEEYDQIMAEKKYMPPMTWIDGWGDRILHKSNCDKLCAFKACAMGLLEQTANGYRSKRAT